ncbi:sugar ABC transporter substrate-binding protein [Suipraeoptans intestinalis]|uniref:sugar ABC transporter substrate-binding protein n=1 Tax=Suipraeoptans intestinalis TaxID=2606628 RepID=UPI0023F2C680|nr:sugar ABC transporter substrate-binding protein [Suipraeoptans intestinalis]MDD7771075.1 sugar ABC transporter substrate-binding protein [Suipraeoptans intestinalis]MDY3121588.1 sugar ABC transporter substrate-binding protein [Suipraeoptans intestinalis]
MKKKVVSVMLAVAMTAALLAGCGAKTGSGEKDSKEKYKVAYVARAQEDSFAAWLADEMKAEFKKYDDMTLEVFDGEANDEKENSIIENCITNGYDAIIVQPNNGEAQLPYIQQVVDAGIPCITTNPRVDCEGTGSVDADPYEQAKVNCELALEQVPQGAKVVVLNGPAGNFHSTERRKAWQKEFFDKRQDVEIVAEDIASWNKDEAMALMEDWVQAYGKIDAVISMNDNMAAGAIEVVKDNADYKGMLAYGVDGTAEACLLIKEGLMTSTGLQSAGDLAKMNVEYVHKVLKGEIKVTDVYDNVPAPLITSENVDEYITMYEKNGQIKK